MNENLRWKKYPVLNDGFICLVDVMGNDSAIVQAARVSYGKDEDLTSILKAKQKLNPNVISVIIKKYEPKPVLEWTYKDNSTVCDEYTSKDMQVVSEQVKKDERSLIRRLMKDSHTSPFEMVEFKFKVRVPMDCWRQWIRHRTANVNEYSTRYSEAIDSQQTTFPEEWRLQAKDNKQGSSGFLEEWPKEAQYSYNTDRDSSTLRFDDNESLTELDYEGELNPGIVLTRHEEEFLWHARELYKQRLLFGVAREQARKDLPLSTYTEAYWKCDLHNIFNFLRLRLDPHAQLEIRLYAQAMYEIVKQVCPVACEAFEDYVLSSKTFSRMEMEILKYMIKYPLRLQEADTNDYKSENMTDNEWKKFLEKIS